MKNIKAILKDIGLGAGIFLGFSVAALLVLFLGVNIFYEKNLIPENIALIIVFVGSFITGIITTIVYFVRRKKNKHKYFSDVGAKFIFYFFLFQGFINAFKSEIILTTESAQKLIEMEWTIFSIAMTAFVFWHVIVSKFIDNSTKENGFGDERLDIITKKQGIYKDAINFSYNLTLLTISMLCLVLTTSSIFVTGEINLYNQFILLFNITIVINALMVIFYDISSPLVVQLIIKKKHKMTDEQISDEILLAITEERLNDLMKDGEKQLSKEEITNLAKEVIAKIKEREELENKEKTNELNA